MTRHAPSVLRQGMRLIPIKYRLGGRVFSNTYNFLLKSDFLKKVIEIFVFTNPIQKKICTNNLFNTNFPFLK